jgi:hypothetical protein
MAAQVVNLGSHAGAPPVVIRPRREYDDRAMQLLMSDRGNRDSNTTLLMALLAYLQNQQGQGEQARQFDKMFEANQRSQQWAEGRQSRMDDMAKTLTDLQTQMTRLGLGRELVNSAVMPDLEQKKEAIAYDLQDKRERAAIDEAKAMHQAGMGTAAAARPVEKALANLPDEFDVSASTLADSTLLDYGPSMDLLQSVVGAAQPAASTVSGKPAAQASKADPAVTGHRGGFLQRVYQQIMQRDPKTGTYAIDPVQAEAVLPEVQRVRDDLAAAPVDSGFLWGLFGKGKDRLIRDDMLGQVDELLYHIQRFGIQPGRALEENMARTKEARAEMGKVNRAEAAIRRNFYDAAAAGKDFGAMFDAAQQGYDGVFPEFKPGDRSETFPGLDKTEGGLPATSPATRSAGEQSLNLSDPWYQRRVDDSLLAEMGFA